MSLTKMKWHKHPIVTGPEAACILGIDPLHPISKERLHPARSHPGLAPGSQRPAGSRTCGDRSQAADGRAGHPGARKQHPDADRPTQAAAPPPQPQSILGCLRPHQGRLGVLRGRWLQPGERSPAGAAGENQALAAVCRPGATDDPVPCRHTSPIIAGSPGGLMLHSVTEAGTSPPGGRVTAHQGRGACLPGRTRPSRVEGCPKGVSLSPLLAASALQAPRSHPAAAAPRPRTTTRGGARTHRPCPRPPLHGKWVFLWGWNPLHRNACLFPRNSPASLL